MIKVLLVEDHIKISQNIKTYLEDEFEVTPVYSAEEAKLYLAAESYDLIILDLMLPGESGMSVLTYIEQKKITVGVIVLTAKEDLGDKLKAFNLGAHDYVTKPFFMEELKARMNVVLKGLGKITKANVLTLKDLTLDMSKKSVTINGEIIEMNEKIYHLLEYFLLNKGILLFKEQIFDRVCGYQSDASTDIIEVYMSRLRKALSPFGYDRYIITKRGMGYMLDETK
ncbi:MAG: response regulator transcription factor [Candidatus Niameybacter stercoravium]|nr:response regulator transcription factor [Candidatus Niameybacter stercoravium]